MKTPFRRILVPHDLSVPATRALRLAAALMEERRGTLTVLHVIPPYDSVMDVPFTTAQESQLVARARRQLEATVRRALAGGQASRVECRVVVGDTLDCILRAARDADSIVIATAGRTGLVRLLIGSVAEKVVRHAPVPVLTVRPAGTRRRAARPMRAVARARAARRATRRR